MTDVLLLGAPILLAGEDDPFADLGHGALAPAISAPQALPPRIHLASAVPGLTLRVVRPPDFEVQTTLRGKPVDSMRAVGYMPQRNEMGTGTFTLNLDDPAYDLIGQHDVVEVLEDSEVVHAFVIEELDEHLLDEDGPARQVCTYSGRGVNRELGYVVVFPARGAGALPKEQDRALDWTSPQAPRVGWVPASVICSVDDARTIWPTTPMGENFPDTGGAAKMIWAASGELETAPLGACLADEVFDITGPGLHVLFILIDNFGFVRADGQHLQDIDIRDGFTKATVLTFELSVGEHNLSVYGRNAGEPGSQGPGAIAYALYKADQVKQPVGDPIIVSDASTLMLEYPTDIPGFTAGEAVGLFLDEGQARGKLPWLGRTFTASTDSAGRPLPIIRGLSTKTGSSLPQFLGELVAAGHLTAWQRDPASRTLSIWGPGYRDPTGIEIAPPTGRDARTGTLATLDRRIR